MPTKPLTTLEKIELIQKLTAEIKADWVGGKIPEKAFDDTGGSNPSGPGQPGKP
jgi:hypothetical protein